MQPLDPGYVRPNRALITMRRLGRQIANLGVRAGAYRLPRFSLVAVGLLGATGLYGMSVGGHTTNVVDALAVPLGFPIETIDVTGNRETSQIDILQALWQTGAESLPSLDPTAAREALEALPWIERASIAKLYPDRVTVDLVEHRPYAVWQRGKEFVIVDREGREIVPFEPGRFSALPVVVGEGAARAAARLVDEMEVLPELRARVKAYIRIADRRWDLRLENGVTIRLPEKQPIEALAEIARMDREQTLLSRDIASVDLRLDDRIVIKLTPEAVTRRNAALEEREKIIKRQRKENPV